MEPDMLILMRSLIGVGVAIIGTGVTLYLRLDAKIDSRIDWVYEKLDAKTDALAHEVSDARRDVAGVRREVVEVKIAVARIEGHLQARDRFKTPRSGDNEGSPTEYRQAG